MKKMNENACFSETSRLNIGTKSINMIRIVFTALVICLSSQLLNAQNGALKAIITDNSDKTKLPGATVSLLLQKDSSLVKTAVTDSTGTFNLTNLVPDSFIVTISTVGYQQYVSFITLGDTSRDLGTISLEKQGKDLGVVILVARTPAVIQKGDTSQFSASQYKVNPDATTEDLIKKMPGITVAKDGTVTAQGEQVKKVTIDGKDFFGDDASAALKNLPSEVVDKIQVFDRLSDQAQLTGFDDGNSVKAINVVTKSGIKNGQFGRIYAGYGTDNRYSAGGNISFFKGERRLSFVGNFNNINQQNFGSQDLLGLTSSGSTRGGGGRGGGRGGGTDNFSVGQSNGISKTDAVGVNYGDKWGKRVSVTGSYFFNNSNNDNSSVVNIETLGAKKQFSSQNGISNTQNNNHRINLRMEYKIDSNNSLFIIPSANFQKNNSTSNSRLLTQNGLGDSVNNSFARTDANRTGYNIRNNILFRHSFPKKGRSLSLGFNVTFTKNDGESIIDARYRYFDSTGIFTTDSIQNQFSDNSTDGRTIGGSIAYTEPVGKKGQLQLEYNPSVQSNSANQQTFLYDLPGQKYTIFDSTLSNKFDNSVTTNNAGLTYRLTKSKDEMFAVGLSYQHSQLESKRIFPTSTSVNQSFSNFLPNAMWRKKLSAYSNVRIFYRASTNFPSVNQLQDVVDLSNPLRVSSGNPLLKQSFTNFLSARYSYTNSKTSASFFANIFLQAANDYISNGIFIIDGADSTIQNGIKLNQGSQLTKPVNLNGYRTLRSFFTYSLPVKSLKTTVNLNAGFIYSKLPGQVNYIANTTNNYVYNGGVVLASNISEYVDFNINYSANFNNASTTGSAIATNKYVNQVAGVTLNLLNKKGWFIQNDVSYQVYNGLSGALDQNFTLWNAAIGKKFLKKQAGELKLSVFDLLKQNQSIIRTVTGTDITDSQSQVLQQYFLLTFTYNLKNFGVAKRASNSEGENMGPGSRRMGGSNF